MEEEQAMIAHMCIFSKNLDRRSMDSMWNNISSVEPDVNCVAGELMTR